MKRQNQKFMLKLKVYSNSQKLLINGLMKLSWIRSIMIIKVNCRIIPNLLLGLNKNKIKTWWKTIENNQLFKKHPK